MQDQDAQMLLRIQECDLDTMRLHKKIEDLPEIQKISACRERRKQIKSKRLAIAQVLCTVKDKLEDLQLESTRVSKKMDELQDTLDHNSDFRVTSAALRDFEGQSKRKANIATEEDEQLEKLADLEEKQGIVENLLKEVDEKEETLTQAFKEKGGALKMQIEKLSQERAALCTQIDATLLARYERLRAEKKGIGVGVLQGRLCSACHAELMDGQYRKLLSGPDLGVCPNCQRLLYTVELEEN